MNRSLSGGCGPAAELADCSLDDLVEMVAGRSRDAFAEMYRRLSGVVFRRARSVLRDTSHAEEITQEVFLEIWQRAGLFDRELGSATSWVMRLTHSRSVDRVRQVQANRVRDSAFARRADGGQDEAVLDGCIRRSQRVQISAAVAELTPLQAEAIRLTVYLGHSYREASELLGIPLPTLKTRIRGGLIALRRNDSRVGVLAR